MKENRIVLKGTNKRDAGGFLLFVFLLPYVCACLWGHAGVEKEALQSKYKEDADSPAHYVQAQMEWGLWEIPLEEYIAYKLESVMPEACESEAIKAQAVLLRTEIVKIMKEDGTGTLRVSGDGLDKWYRAGEEELQKLTPYRQAVKDTAGLYLCYQGEPIQASYFKISNGQTRDASQVWGTRKLPYLKSVPCEQDKTAQDFESRVTVSKTNFIHEIQTYIDGEYSAEQLWEGMNLTYDDSQYVTNVSFERNGEKTVDIDGETFRYLFSLPSASFEIEQTQTQIIFNVTGVGHGFGMSQYAAGCMALNGSTYDQILQQFFFGTRLAKIE